MNGLNICKENTMALQSSSGWAALNQLRSWMAKPLLYRIFRVNTLRIFPEEALEKTQHWLDKLASSQGRPVPKASIHPIFREVIIVPAWPDFKASTEPSPDKKDLPVVIVGTSCAKRAFHGVPIMHGGILAASDNISVGSEVNIFVFHAGFRKWIGYGIVISDPETWKSYPDCTADKPEFECAVHITGGLCILPSMPKDLLAEGCVVEQRLPSIVSSLVLNPQMGDRILDLGLGFGRISGHIAALTSNRAEISAVGTTKIDVNRLINHCKILGAKVIPVLSNFQDFAAKQTDGFDRILVHNNIFISAQPTPSVNLFNELRYFTGVREFVEIAVNLLKPGGRLVYYSTSIVPMDNDGVVRWLLDRWTDLKLEPAEPRAAPVGVMNVLPTASWMRLTADEEKLVQRFCPGSPELEADPVLADVRGAFIACFTKVR